MALPSKIGARDAQQHIDLILHAYQRYFKQPLLVADDASQSLAAIWEAPFILLSHGSSSDPCFNFGNKAAQQLFELSFKELITMPSRQSAQAITQRERAQLLETVTQQGYIDNYRGIRISATGRKFYIERAKVWNLHDETGAYYGQAAAFKSWTYL